jgi:ankyrin repeat protein
LHRASKALVEGGVDILATDHRGRKAIRLAIVTGQRAVAKFLLEQFYGSLLGQQQGPFPIHELFEHAHGNLTNAPPLREALNRNVLDTADVVKIIESLVVQTPPWICARNQECSTELHVASSFSSRDFVQCLVEQAPESVLVVQSIERILSTLRWSMVLPRR